MFHSGYSITDLHIISRLLADMTVSQEVRHCSNVECEAGNAMTTLAYDCFWLWYRTLHNGLTRPLSSSRPSDTQILQPRLSLLPGV